MGFGDQLIAAGLAEHRYAQPPSDGPVTITDCAGTPRWQPLWEGNPAIGVRQYGGPRIACGAGCLPYLDYPRRDSKLTFSSTYRAANYRAHVYLTHSERQRGLDLFRHYGPYLMIEPSPADRKNVNRQWPVDSWAECVSLLQQRSSNITILQFEHPEMTRLPGIPAIPSPTFRDACGILAAAKLALILEGGLAFACAALATPAVVLWGGCVSAPTLSFPEHVNIVDQQPATPCGSLKLCLHCRTAWQMITPAVVATAVDRTWRASHRPPPLPPTPLHFSAVVH